MCITLAVALLLNDTPNTASRCAFCHAKKTKHTHTLQNAWGPLPKKVQELFWHVSYKGQPIQANRLPYAVAQVVYGALDTKS